MKAWGYGLVFFWAIFYLCSVPLRAFPTSQQLYLELYLECNDAAQLEKQKDYLGALVRYKISGRFLDKLHKRDPGWEIDLLEERIHLCRDKVTELTPLAAEQILVPTRSTLSWGPGISRFFYEGSDLEQKKMYWSAIIPFEEYLTCLEVIQHDDPKWQKDAVEKRIEEIRDRIVNLDRLALHEIR